MIPNKSAVEKAGTASEVLSGWREFLRSLRNCRVDSVLPIDLDALSAQDALDVRSCMIRLERARQLGRPLTAAGAYWMDELYETLRAAIGRLEQLTPAAAGTPEKSVHA
ncbi:MAG TPA: hypothetical protein VFB20_04925 [Burkholderiales bacterium]|nr:hypothetical protein [Burkholderiales bacterium]